MPPVHKRLHIHLDTTPGSSRSPGNKRGNRYTSSSSYALLCTLDEVSFILKGPYPPRSPEGWVRHLPIDNLTAPVARVRV
jgi:hypothetical protein